MAEGGEVTGSSRVILRNFNFVIGDGSTTVAGWGGPCQSYLTVARSSGYSGRSTRRSSSRCYGTRVCGGGACAYRVDGRDPEYISGAVRKSCYGDGSRSRC